MFAISDTNKQVKEGNSEEFNITRYCQIGRSLEDLADGIVIFHMVK